MTTANIDAPTSPTPERNAHKTIVMLTSAPPSITALGAVGLVVLSCKGGAWTPPKDVIFDAVYQGASAGCSDAVPDAEAEEAVVSPEVSGVCASSAASRVLVSFW